MTATAEGRTNSPRSHCPTDRKAYYSAPIRRWCLAKGYANQKPLDPFGERQIRNRATHLLAHVRARNAALCTLTPHLLGYLASPMCWHRPLRPSCFIITAVEACLEVGHCRIRSLPRDDTFLSHVPMRPLVRPDRRVTHTRGWRRKPCALACTGGK